MLSTPRLHAQFTLLQAIRDFFRAQGMTDVLTPPMVPNPGMEPHIHPYEIHGLGPYGGPRRFLHTSPEFCMKELLSQGHQKIFTLGYSFRHEPVSPHHRPQFLMLEWYRANARYESIMDDVEGLIQACAQDLSTAGIEVLPDMRNTRLVRKTVQELFSEVLHIDILSLLKKKDLLQVIQKDFPNVPLPPGEEGQDLSWDDLFFLLFLNEVEPKLSKWPALLLSEYPHHLSALSTLKSSDPRVCERFEVYLNGVELCNCYNELTDLVQQRERFRHQAELKRELYGIELPEATVLYSALERGLPPSAGVALGVERLLMALTGLAPDQAFWD